MDFDLIKKVALGPMEFEPMAPEIKTPPDEDLPGITMEEINAVIREVRKERAARKAANPAAARAQDEAALADYLAGRTTDTRGLEAKIAAERPDACDLRDAQVDIKAHVAEVPQGPQSSLPKDTDPTPQDEVGWEARIWNLALAAASQKSEGPHQPLQFQVEVVDLLPSFMFGGGWADGPFANRPGARLFLDYQVGERVFYQGYVRQGLLGWFPADQMAKVRRLPEGWERAYTRILAKAVDVMGTREKADSWLRVHNEALGDRQPLALLDTKEGAQELEDLLGRIEHGVFE